MMICLIRIFFFFQSQFHAKYGGFSRTRVGSKWPIVSESLFWMEFLIELKFYFFSQIARPDGLWFCEFVSPAFVGVRSAGDIEMVGEYRASLSESKRRSTGFGGVRIQSLRGPIDKETSEKNSRERLRSPLQHVDSVDRGWRAGRSVQRIFHRGLRRRRWRSHVARKI